MLVCGGENTVFQNRDHWKVGEIATLASKLIKRKLSTGSYLPLFQHRSLASQLSEGVRLMSSTGELG
jgi:hypothetical protein